MSRTARPVNEDRASAAIVLLISQCGADDRPCPTIRDLMEITTLQRRRLKRYLADMVERGVIEIERKGNRRRMRVFCGAWTDWSRQGDIAHARRERWAHACA